MLVEGSLSKLYCNSIASFSFVSLVSDTVSVENISSAEILPTEESMPEINQIDSNALLVSSEKVKIKVASEILSPKA